MISCHNNAYCYNEKKKKYADTTVIGVLNHTYIDASNIILEWWKVTLDIGINKLLYIVKK